MLLVNTEMKAIYIPLPHTGSKYISEILFRYYGFNEFHVKKEDISDFYKTEDQLVYGLEVYDSEFYSITDKGIVRFILDEDTGDVYDTKITKEMWDSFYKFTFVNDPYTRVVRSFIHCKNNIFKDDIFFNLADKYEEKTDINAEFLENCDLQDLIKSRDDLPNAIINSTFITQTQHLLDNNNNINFQFIGNTKFIDRDLITALITIGFTEIKHFKRKNWTSELMYYCQLKNIHEHLSNENIEFINNFFKEDFENFHFHKYTSVDEMKYYILPNTTSAIHIISNLFYDNYVKTYLLYANTKLAEQAELSYKQHRQILKNTFKLDTTNILDKQYNKITEKFFTLHNENSKINDTLHLDITKFVNIYQNETYTCDNHWQLNM